MLNRSTENNLPVKSSLVIGDLNLSKHSRRMNKLKVGMNSRDVNSWPNKPYIPVLLGLAIDQLWLSKPRLPLKPPPVLKHALVRTSRVLITIKR